jgi:hypothetical protein
MITSHRLLEYLLLSVPSTLVLYLLARPEQILDYNEIEWQWQTLLFIAVWQQLWVQKDL